MRAAFLMISLAACTRAESTQDERPPPPKPPAVRPAPPELQTDLATQLDSVTLTGCNLRVSGSGRNERNIPLDQVTWTLGANSKKRPTANAACTQPKCIQGRAESHTTGTPHVSSWDHYESDTDVVFITGADPAKVIAELGRVGRLCKRS